MREIERTYAKFWPTAGELTLRYPVQAAHARSAAQNFTIHGAGVKTNLLFFTKGKPTEAVWYYDLSDIKVGKKTPLTVDRFEEFFGLFPERGDSERSWTVSRADIEAKNYDLKAVNPNAKVDVDTRTPEELLDEIEARGREVAAALAELHALLASGADELTPTI